MKDKNLPNDISSKSLDQLTQEADDIIKLLEKTNNLEQTITSFKPPIFWKEKGIVAKQIKSWSLNEIKNKIYDTNNLEMLVKKNTINSINIVSDFICNN